MGQGGTDSSSGLAEKRAAVHHSLWWALTSSTEGGRGRGLTDTALAHTFAVCMLEMDTMARGGKKAVETVKPGGMPRFVDIKLTAEDRADFSRQTYTPDQVVTMLQSLCDDGYRVGCTWSGEQQSYTVSITGRDPVGVNFGLCMTSFAPTLHKAVSLALYKHTVVTEERWLGDGPRDEMDFG